VRVTAAFAVAAVLASVHADAQICAGRQAFGNAPLQAGAEAAFGGDRQHVALSLDGGSDALFGRVLAGVDNSRHARRYAIAAAVGADQPLTLDNRFHACPVVAIEHAHGDGRMLRLEGGLTFGMLLRNRPGLAIVPTLGVALRNDRIRGTRGTVGVASAGVGFVFGRGVAIGPRVELPFGASRDSLSVVAGASIALR
jgi:hypothetical protein